VIPTGPDFLKKFEVSIEEELFLRIEADLLANIMIVPVGLLIVQFHY
jgi:hypothetical protein